MELSKVRQLRESTEKEWETVLAEMIPSNTSSGNKSSAEVQLARQKTQEAQLYLEGVAARAQFAMMKSELYEQELKRIRAKTDAAILKKVAV